MKKSPDINNMLTMLPEHDAFDLCSHYDLAKYNENHKYWYTPGIKDAFYVSHGRIYWFREDFGNKMRVQQIESCEIRLRSAISLKEFINKAGFWNWVKMIWI